MLSKESFNQGLLEFISRSPTPFHAVATMSAALQDAGFSRLDESSEWTLEPGHKYFLTRNDSSIIAFVIGEGDVVTEGIHMLGAHTDSPCLRVKPNPDMHQHGTHQLGLEVYGGVLLNPWFDRDLSMAGRVSYVQEDGCLANALVDFKRPIAVVPSLAVHLDRGVNDKRSINKQTDLPAILSLTSGGDKPLFKELLLTQLQAEGCPDATRVLDYEISLYDTQPPALTGLSEQFINAARLDNLLSCYVGLQGILAAETAHSSLLVCNDHEEVGSASAAGANGPMLHDCLSRLCGDHTAMVRCMQNSLMISADNAHGIHPNFASKHDGNHGPRLNDGVVIKVNANQRYASNSQTSAAFRLYAEAVDAPVQTFVVRSDMGCGSTIGPITATELGVPTVDVGAPTFAMHSIREMAGSDDAWQLARISEAFFSRKA